jgi:class 3 adenylate cyclase
LRQSPGYSFGFSPEGERLAVGRVLERWGSGAVLGFSSPAAKRAPDGLEWLARFERAAGSPRRAALKQARAFEIDIRDVLPAITVPTLVVHSRDNRYISLEHARYLVNNIAGATYLEIAGADHAITDASEAGATVAGAVEEFLTGSRRPPALDRALRTVVFTDIVGSTELASNVGDSRWRSLLEEHETASRREIEAARGRVVKFTGDGVMATFDGPARAVHCVQAMNAQLQALGLPIRAGVHTGEVELIGDDIGGIAVHIAARISALAGPGEVLTSSTVRDLVAGSGLEFDDRGEQELKGLPGTWRVLAVR